MSRPTTAVTKEFACIPVYLEPRQRLGITRCEVIPGVTLSKTSERLRRTLGATRVPVSQLFRADHVILIDIDKYADALNQRIRAAGRQVPAGPTRTDWPDNPNRWLVSPADLARQVLVSLILLQRFRFILGGSYDLEFGQGGFRVKSYAHAPIQEVSHATAQAIPLAQRERIDPKNLRRIALLLDPYYRGGLWQTDRMAVALSSLWAALCTPFIHHSFLSLAIVLEALLSDGGAEITHKLAERAAALISRARAQRPAAYGVVKALYSIRSKLVHGDAHMKKGVVNWDSFHVSAKTTIVPVSKLDELGRVVNQVIHAVLSRSELLTIIHKQQSEEKTSRELDDFFLRLTLT